MRIAVLASEAVPFVKTGGLADVAGGLSKALAALGHQVVVVLPRYSMIDGDRWALAPAVSPLRVWMGNTEECCATQTTEYGGVRFYFIESSQYFDRDGLYHDYELEEYRDNGRRFGFFTRAALQLCRDLGFAPHIVHAHDWQTSLAPAYLKLWHWDDPVLGGAASVLTIHNIAFQGKCDRADYDYLGLQWGNFTPDKFEDSGGVNMLKGGIHYADLVTTVSPTYAEETRGDIGGSGLAPFLNNKDSNYWGILNGVDYADWSPALDGCIPAHYAPENMAGKRACKDALQRRLLLDADPTIPVIGVVSRFAFQKGLDLLAQTIEGIVNTMRVQFAILGSGDKHLEWTFGPLPGRYPGRIGCWIGYEEELCRWIEAGSDFFLMPSRFEPCGLNQMYSLKYGTLPIVRDTGGLSDTVEQYNETTGAGTGFKFQAATAQALYDTIGWAVSTYYDRPHHMEAMVQRAMSQDFSWQKSARTYELAFGQAISNKRGLG